MLNKPYYRFAFIEGQNIDYWDLSLDNLESNSNLFECWYLDEIELVKGNVVFADPHTTGVAKKDFTIVVGHSIIDWDHKEMFDVSLLKQPESKQKILEGMAIIATGLRKENAKSRNQEKDLKEEINVCTFPKTTKKKLQKATKNKKKIHP